MMKVEPKRTVFDTRSPGRSGVLERTDWGLTCPPKALYYVTWQDGSREMVYDRDITFTYDPYTFTASTA